MNDTDNHSPTLFDSDDENAVELQPTTEETAERGERIVEEADLSWGTLRHSHKEHFCYRKRKAIALWAFSVFMIALLIGLVSIAVVVIEALFY